MRQDNQNSSENYNFEEEGKGKLLGKQLSVGT